MKILILLVTAGCCIAAPPKRQAKHYESVIGGENYQDPPTFSSDVFETPYVHDQGQERRSVSYDEHIPGNQEFGVKVYNTPRVKKVFRSRARAVLGNGFKHNYNYVQTPSNYVPDNVYQPVASPKALVPPYQQKQTFQRDNQYQPNYNQYYNQQRTDDVPQPGASYGPAPGYPSAALPASVSEDKVDATPKPIAILAMNQDVNYDGTFVYDFEAENGIKSAVSGSTKHVEGFEKPVQVMSGSYSYTSPEGEPVETRWFADETGFHAEGSHLPVAPPVPEAIQRAVDYLKTLPPQEDEVAYQPLPANPDVPPQRFDPSQQYNKYPSYQQNYENPPNYQQNYPSSQQQYYPVKK